MMLSLTAKLHYFCTKFVEKLTVNLVVVCMLLKTNMLETSI